MEVITISSSKKIKFDILNYIDLRGPEVKEVFLTILNAEVIKESTLLDYYLLDVKKIPKYFTNITKLLLQVGLITKEKDIYKAKLPFPDLSFELNFFHRLSRLDDKNRITYDIHKEIIAQDILSMKNEDFLPWCLETFKNRYIMTKNSASFWISFVSNLGFIQKLKFNNRVLFLTLPNMSHYEELLWYYQKQNNNENIISIKDFAKFISNNFFEVFNKEKNLSINFQDWLKFLDIKKFAEVRMHSDATEFQVKDKKITHIEIKLEN